MASRLVRMYALRQAVQPDELAQVAFDSLPERTCALDRDGWIVLANHAWNQSARENGASLSQCGPGVNYLRICRTATGSFAEGAWEAAMGIETVLRGAAPQFTLDYPCLYPSRKAWFRLVVRPLLRPNSGAVVSHSEITSQVLLAERLRRTQAHYRALLENPVDAATVLASDGTIRYQSPASEGIFGIRPDALVGRAIFEFVHPDDTHAVRELLRACLRYAQCKHPCEFRFGNRNGSWRVLESVGRKLVSNPEGGIILNSRDVTHQKMAEKNLRAKQDAMLRSREELEALAARLFREQDDERRRVAAELSGNLSQRLASMRLQAAHLAAGAAALGQSQALEECAASLGRDLQRLAGVLHPPTLEHLGLAVALREYCAEFTRKHGTPVHYVHRGISARLPGHIAASLYRVAIESLVNVAKHARANHTWVTLSRTAKGIRMAIRDDGAGFDPSAIDPGSGLGVLAMRERLRAVRGSLSIGSRQGAGTEVVALAPLFPTGNQTRAAISRNVVVDPLDQHQQAIVEFHQIHQVHEQPHEPRDGSGEMQPAKRRHGFVASDRG
ncbi:MAG TPA: PAS domain-containing sensor histidine kinase [Bryobacteraceae bacterium]|nr:PAS domain-containing sensor histidine kinase [Bryobacteraceae bacterium]